MKKPVLITTHLLALGVGWLAFQAVDSASGSTGPAAGRERSSRSERRDEQAEGRRLLSEIRKSWRVAEAAMNQGRTFAPPPAEFDYAQALKQQMEQDAAQEKKLLGLAATMTLPADPAAELKKLMESSKIDEAMALIIAWLRGDPAAAMQALNGNQELRRLGNAHDAIRLWSKESTPQAILDLMESAPEWRPLLTGLALQKAVASDLASLGGLIDSLDGLMEREALFRSAFDNLPAKRRSEALDWIFANLKGREAARAIQNIAFDAQSSQRDAPGAKALLRDAMARMDPEALESMKGWGNLRGIMSTGIGPDSPMDERVDAALMAETRGKTPEEKRANARATLVSGDVQNWLDAGQWSQALLAHSVSPAELWAEAKSAFPQFDQEADQTGILRAIFLRSALSDPQAAFALLKAEGKEDQLGKYAYQAVDSGWFHQLEASIALANAIPPEVFRENLSSFDRSYSYQVEREVTARGSFWLDWVKQQPAGLNRDLLYHYTARSLYKQGKEAEGDAFKAAVQDPKVKSWPKL